MSSASIPYFERYPPPLRSRGHLTGRESGVAELDGLSKDIALKPD